VGCHDRVEAGRRLGGGSVQDLRDRREVQAHRGLGGVAVAACDRVDDRHVLGVGVLRPVGAGIAFYFLATGVAGLELLGVQNYVQELFYGSVLVIAIVISRLARSRTSTA
jgi:NO-binding membrane sensor protein with MHYT domain